MPRTTSQKKKLFALYQILYEYTDDNNGLTMAKILSKLQNRGITAERRSIFTVSYTHLTDFFESIKKLSELKESGILTQEEFETKKAELLAKIQ